MDSKKNTEKRCNSSLHSLRSRRKRQKTLIIAVVASFLAILSGGTFAFLITSTDLVVNTFESTHVACAVLENGSDGTSPFDGKVKTNVKIKNTGEVQSYIRAKVVVTWMSEDEKQVTASKPIDDTDYIIVYADEHASENVPPTNWVRGADGYWYYTVPVNVEATTTNLIESCSLVNGVTPPEGYYLSVEIVASAIQSTPINVVTTVWGSCVSDVSTDTATGQNKLVVKPGTSN